MTLKWNAILGVRRVMKFTVFILVCSGIAFIAALPTRSQTLAVNVQTSTVPAGMPTGVETVFVPKDTPVIVALDNALNSYAAASREPLDYTVTQDTVVNGHIVAGG